MYGLRFRGLVTAVSEWEGGGVERGAGSPLRGQRSGVISRCRASACPQHRSPSNGARGACAIAR